MRSSRFMAGLLLSVVCCLAAHAEPDKPEEADQRGEAVTRQSFPGLLSVVKVIDADTLLCRTGDGWYRGDMRNNRWRQFISLEHGLGKPELHHVGSGETLSYFLEELRGKPTQLVRYDQRSQKRYVIDEGASHASFVDDSFGVISDEDRGIRFTRDGGESWFALAEQPDFGLKHIVLSAVGHDAVMVIQASGTGRVWYQPLPTKQAEQAPMGWAVRLPIAPSRFIGVRDECIWLLGSDLLGLDLKDGSVRYRLPIHYKAIKVLIDKDWILILYPNRVEAVRLVDEEWETVFVDKMPYRIFEADFHTDEQGKKWLALAIGESRLAMWGPLDEHTKPDIHWKKTLTFENGPAVDDPIAAKRLNEAIEAISKKARRVVALSRQVPPEQRDAIDQRIALRKDLDPEEIIDHLIAAYEEYLQANPPKDK